MSWNDRRVNNSTANPSKKWERDLGIESAEIQQQRLRGQLQEPQLITPTSDAIQSSAFDREQVIELCRVNLNFLAALAMPVVFKHMFPATHLTAWQIFTQSIEDPKNKFPQIALGIPRGHAKTTLIKLAILYTILFTKKTFTLITGSTEKHAVNILSDVIDMLDEPNVRNTFGNWRLGAENDTKDFKKFGFRGRNIILAAIGAEGSVRGMNVKNERPDLIIFDDIQTKECADSRLQSETLESWMIGTAMKAKSPNGCMFLFAGNMFPTPHSILKKLRTNPTWIKFISGAILVDGTALWPELRSVESLIAELDNDIAMGHPEIFFSEVMNDTEAGVNTNVDFTKFAQWQWTKHDLPQGKFLIIDPSQGKNLDQDVIVHFEIYDETLAVRSILEERLSPGNLIRKALIIALREQISLIAIEAMAYQYTLLYWFEEVCKSAQIVGIQCVPLYATNHSKNSRISAGMKALQAKEIVLHDSVKSRVQKQIADWNPMKKNNVDDIIDGISYGPKVLAEYAYEIASNTSAQVIEALAANVVEDNTPF